MWANIMKRCLTCVLVAIVGGMNASSQSYTGPRDDSSDLTIHVVDANGVSIPYRVTSLKNRLSPAHDLAASSRGMKVSGLSSGPYDYVLSPTDPTNWSDISGYVPIARGEHRWLSVLARQRDTVQYSRSIGPEQNRGIVSGIDTSNGPIWVRLLHAFTGATVEEVAVDRNGEFRFSYFHTGKYIVVVCHATEVSYVGTLAIDGVLNKPLELKVGTARR